MGRGGFHRVAPVPLQGPAPPLAGPGQSWLFPADFWPILGYLGLFKTKSWLIPVDISSYRHSLSESASSPSWPPCPASSTPCWTTSHTGTSGASGAGQVGQVGQVGLRMPSRLLGILIKLSHFGLKSHRAIYLAERIAYISNSS